MSRSPAPWARAWCPQNSSSPPLRSSACTFAGAQQQSQPSWPLSTGGTIVVIVVIISSRCLEQRAAGPGEPNRTPSRIGQNQTRPSEPRARELVGEPPAIDHQVPPERLRNLAPTGRNGPQNSKVSLTQQDGCGRGV